MKVIRTRLRQVGEYDSGLTIIEIMVAMMVFAMIAVGVAYSMTLVLTMGNDGRAREVAANLAAQELDLNRSVDDIFSLVDTDKTAVVNGTSFYIHRDANWVTSAGADANCGSGGGQLQYKRLNVSVTWDGMRPTTLPVRSDTVISPGSKINDPALGTILVSVLSASGTGTSGVTVTATPATPANGAATIVDTPDPTDAQGCSYVLKVVPGNYNVTLSRTNSIDVKQNLAPTSLVGVAAGAAASVSFQYDLIGSYGANYVSNYSSGSTLIPSNLDTSFHSTYGDPAIVSNTNSLSRTFSLYPMAYEPMAGQYVDPVGVVPTCLSVYPAMWTTPAPGDGAVGHTPALVSTTPGNNTSVPIPMGVLTVSGLSGKYLKAVSQVSAPLTGDPGCTKVSTYTFGILPSSPQQIALPYGSWLLYSGNAVGTQTTPVLFTGLATLTRGAVAVTGVVTLDPRTVLP